ncbi:MAG: 23S rRNA (pseudouridine(1915)-N(3))-methyltransferase RlmH [Methanocorpusculum sp.]|nr:23S rRNA (pseudouridine(1915)-N(3))-methyltransferase RlmH [Methanocorpusculum sp.]
MQIQILCIGKIKDAYLAEGIAEFGKRLRPYVKLTVTELSEVRIPENASAADERAVKEKEGVLLLKNIKDGFYAAALDPHAPLISSEELAEFIGDAKIEGRNLCFIIGGPLGLSPEVVMAVPKKVSFSRMTFTHTMCRLILFEQVYRAFRILNAEPYHK